MIFWKDTLTRTGGDRCFSGCANDVEGGESHRFLYLQDDHVAMIITGEGGKF
jgi:hypothetical protein